MLRLAGLLSVVAIFAFSEVRLARAENWPVWRGPRGDGSSLETNLPTHWSAASNVVWKTELPGKGHASPIVWQDKIFTVTCLPETQERKLLCLDRASGKFFGNRRY